MSGPGAAPDGLPIYELGDPEAPYGISAHGGGYMIVRPPDGIRAFDETHTHTNEELFDAITGIARAQRDAEHEAREAAAREYLYGRVFDAMCDVDYVDYGEPDTQGMARAAIEVFVDFLRNPPVREIQPDGTEVVRWPDAPRS